ncbi:MAG: phosphatidylserine/phosphatidylglycerophosphate/cardiolipin synthase family protein [Herpetosiphonaceae bacterium]|nr:phosphatidylserine/phosphatidylglycerophosphate/cardiolipin synthase family protein [Herpetosiphonaceae bacterium]
MSMTNGATVDDLNVLFLAQGEQQAVDVAKQLASFIDAAQDTLDIATYDFRLRPELKTIISDALARRATAGVAIRIAYDADKPAAPNWEVGMDPAPGGSGSFVQSLGYPWRRIGGMKLMHNKYLVRDGDQPYAQVWTGSTNLTDDAWTLQENNVVQIASAQLAAYYRQDFEDLWTGGQIENTGDFNTQPVTLRYAAAPAAVQVLFSPGRGPAIDYDVAQLVAGAQHRVRICSMLLNSGALLSALNDLLRIGRVSVSGVYDQTQMASVLQQWQDVPHNHWKISAVHDIVQAAGLIGKLSTPYSPTSPHDFMHNKVLVVDDAVITGSYNFSHSAELNAENILLIQSPALADQYSRYIDHLMKKYNNLPVT